MSFVVTKRPVAAMPIEVIVNGTNGNPMEIKFIAQYHRHTPQQLADLRDGMTDQVRAGQGLEPLQRPGGTRAPAYQYASDIDFLKDKMASWLGVRDGAGESITYSVDQLEALLADWPELVIPLFNGFFGAHEGAKKKN
ncbi:hypothetical protein ACM1PE_09000 [Achromobacter sp. PD1]|jgi:hypothetical protein|uniref:hypothetical protein n=1 Tax=Achromobacter TaxID=222 RepID=UPI0027BA55ED|nr:hypothetical protein [Achromobacter aegrifaciens]WLW63682.1 hypothetical protein RA224_09725 [Achromobacter aegrifaciens]